MSSIYLSEVCTHNVAPISQPGGNGESNGDRDVSPSGASPIPTSRWVGTDSIMKPANDNMNYRHLVLANGLRVLLMSDPTTDKAGAALDVRVGSLSDPDALPGLAHLTEHMLFYSSEKYPKEDEYSKFISDRGGMTNAYTAAEHTNYHFDVNWDSLEAALDRFAQFFIAPTISRDGIEREVKAVDSEHGKNLQSDPWRQSQVNKATANPSHPWSRFSTGNYETLFTGPVAAGTDPRDAVVDFYQSHYSADRCALAVLGRQSLDELEQMVGPMFAAVRNKELPRSGFGGDIFLPDQTGVLIKLVPVKEGQVLELMWQVAPTERLYREQPLGYLSHLLGHEGDGSIFARLKDLGWSSSLWAGESGGSMSFTSFFTIHIELTEEGQRNIQDVATVVFRYLALLRQPGGVNERIWEEVRGLAQLQFDTRDRTAPLSYCRTLASGLQLYPPKDVLPAVYGVPREFSPSCIQEALELLTPERVRAIWISKRHNTSAVSPVAAAPEAEAAVTEASSASAQEAVPAAREVEEAEQEEATHVTEELRTEPIYGTRYAIIRLPSEWLAAWSAARPEDDPKLHLPAPNRFIPTDFSLADDESAAAGALPTVAVALPGRLRLWHKPETRFRQPKAVLYLDIQSPEAYGSPRAAVMTRLFTKMMIDYLNEMTYPALQAGLDFNILNTQSGWQVLLSGFNHKLPELLSVILERLADFKVLHDRFEYVREGVVREYANQMHNQPYSWAMYRAEMLTTGRRWPIEAYSREALSITADELQFFVRQRLCSRCFVEGLAAGNLRRQEVLRCAALLLRCLRDHCGAAPLHAAELAELRMIEIPPTPQAPHLPSQCPSPAPAAVGVVATHGSAVPSNVLDSDQAPVQVQEAVQVQDVVQVPPHSREVSAAMQPSGTEAEAAKTEEEMKDKVAKAEGSSNMVATRGGVSGQDPPFQDVSGGWLFAEEVPNPQDENSVGLVMYQAGPDDLRRNALRSLLVQLAKRDAFSELRTRQQLGYVVSLHNGAEHGVGYVEMLVQSNAYDADELCKRMDDFMQNFLDTGLPEKCGLAPITTTAAASTEVMAAAGAPKGDVAIIRGENASSPPSSDEGEGSSTAPATASAAPGTATATPTATVDIMTTTTRTEFEVAVEELAKSKLEKPKKLDDLTNRWWSEVYDGSYCFNRQEEEVAHLRSLTSQDLMAFAQELLASGSIPTTSPVGCAFPYSPCSPPPDNIPSTMVAGTRWTSGEAVPAAGPGEGAGQRLVPYSCRRLSVQIRGKGEAVRAAAAQQQQQQTLITNIPTSAGSSEAATPSIDCSRSDVAAAVRRRGRPYSHIPATDPFSWKRSCVLFPSVRALWASRRRGSLLGTSESTMLLPLSLAEEEVERFVL